jgi:hypothetical protein
MLFHAQGLACDFVHLPFSKNISQKNGLRLYLIF